MLMSAPVSSEHRAHKRIKMPWLDRFKCYVFPMNVLKKVTLSSYISGDDTCVVGSCFQHCSAHLQDVFVFLVLSQIEFLALDLASAVDYVSLHAGCNPQ